MSRFYVPTESVIGNLIRITGKEAHHITNVLRLAALDKVVTFDGTGREYVGFISQIGNKSVTIEIVETRTPAARPSSEITLIQAIPKKEKMDYIVEKATELGVGVIVPLVTKRTIPAWDQSKKDARVQRWRKIVVEASKQCGRVDVPKVEAITTLPEALKAAGDFDAALIAALDEGAVHLREAIVGFTGGRITIAIGPEGDFTSDEITAALQARFRLVSLGRNVLKSDTAGLAALAIMNYELSR